MNYNFVNDTVFFLAAFFVQLISASPKSCVVVSKINVCWTTSTAGGCTSACSTRGGTHIYIDAYTHILQGVANVFRYTHIIIYLMLPYTWLYYQKYSHDSNIWGWIRRKYIMHYFWYFQSYTIFLEWNFKKCNKKFCSFQAKQNLFPLFYSSWYIYFIYLFCLAA